MTTPTLDVGRTFSKTLHGARGLFASMVVIFHVANSRLPTLPILTHPLLSGALKSCQFGVELFFGVSGVVIYGALRRAEGPAVFAVERATRIYPVLWATLFVIISLSGLTGFEGRTIPGLPVLAENLLALPPLFDGPVLHPAAWSLSYELGFYALCAGGWALRTRLGPGAWLAIFIVSAWLLYDHVRAVLMPVGLLTAVALRRHPRLARVGATPGLWLIIYLFAWSVFVGRNGGDLMQVHLSTLTTRTQIASFGVALGAAALLFIGILRGEGLLCRALISRPAQFLGTISFSLYLWHPIIMSMVKHVMYVAHLPGKIGPFSQIAFLLLSAPPSILVGWGSQLTLERRVTYRLRRLIEPQLGIWSRVRPHQIAP